MAPQARVRSDWGRVSYALIVPILSLPVHKEQYHSRQNSPANQSPEMKGIDAYGRSNPKAGGPLARLHRHTGTSTL